MAYDTNSNPGEMAGASTPESMPARGKNTFHLTADMFPEGMAQTLKAGEVIEFKIVAPLDKDGDVEVEYNYGEEEPEGNDSAPEGEGTWDDEARKVLNPQAEESEAM